MHSREDLIKGIGEVTSELLKASCRRPRAAYACMEVKLKPRLCRVCRWT
jgi:hypothetical protein